MTVSAGFIASIIDMLQPLGTITSRKMFGAAAIYCDGQVFALLDDDVLYLKVDERTRPAFLAENCGPFTYATKDGTHVMAAYHKAPDRLLDEPDDLMAWARDAIAVGRRSATAGKAKVRKLSTAKTPAKVAKNNRTPTR